MDYKAFKALVREMRTAQRNKPFLPISGSVTAGKLKKYLSEHEDYIKQLRALEKRVDDELAQKVENDPNVIIMKNGQKLVQGSLF